MRSVTATGLLDRLEIILEALSEMPAPLHTEQGLDHALHARGQRPLTGPERRALVALGRDLTPSPAD